KLRDENPALAGGASIVRAATGRLLAVSRMDAAARREYVAAFNAGTTAARVTVPTSTPGASWTALLGAQPTAASGPDGELTLELPPVSSTLLRADSDLGTGT